MLSRKGVVGVVGFLNGNANNTIRNSIIQIGYAHPILIIVIATATYTVTIVSNNFFATHSGTGTRPSQQVIVITANAALVPLGTTARREQIIHLAPVKVGVPGDNIVV